MDLLIEEVEWLGVATVVAARERFTHFDLIFADVLKGPRRLRCDCGNPPVGEALMERGGCNWGYRSRLYHPQAVSGRRAPGANEGACKSVGS